MYVLGLLGLLSVSALATDRIVPPLLHKKFYKGRDLCADARKRNAELPADQRKSLIAIFHKSHLCDYMSMTCLNTFRSITNPCNLFLHENFHVYHSRTYIIEDKDGKANMTKGDGSDEIYKAFGNMGPVVLVLDVKTCRFARFKEDPKKKFKYRALPGYVKKASGEYESMLGKTAVWKHEDPATRFKGMAESLLRFPHVQTTLGYTEANDVAEGDLYCAPEKLRESFLPFANAEGKLIRENVDKLRKLLNDQYNELFPEAKLR